MIYDINSDEYASFLIVSPGSFKSGAQNGPGNSKKKAEVKAKGSDGKYQGE